MCYRFHSNSWITCLRSRFSLMPIEADYTTWVNTFLFPFMPVIFVFLASFIMLGDLPWTDDDDDDDDQGGGLMTPVYNYAPQGT